MQPTDRNPVAIVVGFTRLEHFDGDGASVSIMFNFLLHFGESSSKPGFTSGKPGFTSLSLRFGVKANHESRSLRPAAARIGLRARGTLSIAAGEFEPSPLTGSWHFIHWLGFCSSGARVRLAE